MQSKSLFTSIAAGFFLFFVALESFCAVHTVVIEGMKFIPEKLSVKLNDTVIWVNKDFFPHTATTVKKGFDSKGIESNSSWTFIAKDKGVFPYTCTLHPTMNATLTVN